jgi:uncharacterized membrane protein
MELAVEFVYAIGAVVCHQLPDRSFFVSGTQWPVCARCTGLYLGGVAGMLGWLGWKIARGWRLVRVPPREALRLVVIAGAPTAITFATGIAGVWDGSNLSRALLAAPLGLTAGAVVASVFTKDLR